MALGKRAIGPRWVVIVAPLNDGTVLADPAVDIENSDIEAYIESLFDTKHLKYFPAEKPSMFLLHQLTSKQRDNMDICIGNKSMESYLIKCSIGGIQNYKIVNEDGEAIDCPAPDRKIRGDLGYFVSDEWYEKAGFQTKIKNALATMIMVLSDASPPLLPPAEQPAGQKS